VPSRLFIAGGPPKHTGLLLGCLTRSEYRGRFLFSFLISVYRSGVYRI